MKLKNLLSRADEYTLQQMMGSQTVKILRLLKEGSLYNSELKELILRLHTPQLLLQNKQYRNLLIDMMKEEEVKTLSRILGLYSSESSLSDIYKNIQKANFRQGSKRQRSLFDFFNVRYLEEEIVEVVSEYDVQSNYSLFPHQRVAALKTNELLSKDNKRVLLHMPTGSGKTRTTMNIICDHFRNNEPTLIVWFATTEELCIQAAEEFVKAWSTLGNRSIEVHNFWGDSDLNITEINEGFIVAGLPKMVSRFKSNGGNKFISEMAKKTSFIIMDEAHHL